MKLKELLQESLKQMAIDRHLEGDVLFFKNAICELHSVRLTETGQQAFDIIKEKGQEIVDNWVSAKTSKQDTLRLLADLEKEIKVLGKLELPVSNLTPAELDEVFLYKGALMWINNIIDMVNQN